MFKTVVVLFSLVWASLILVSWSGGEQIDRPSRPVVAEKAGF
ncbi:MAG: hypothetical protein PHC98_11050 [Syntrophotalea acetylenica]|jgi:hypothetical protein|nr:hypothetical protein [Syntrophotalea acetylenica]MDD4458101.1 hypothetical protein [Syntrophotalea acetylenica]MDY0261299.1 hypothetical protein [Syntrophotalea acetylenica]